MEHQTLGQRVICPSEPAYHIVDCRISKLPKLVRGLKMPRKIHFNTQCPTRIALPAGLGTETKISHSVLVIIRLREFDIKTKISISHQTKILYSNEHRDHLTFFGSPKHQLSIWNPTIYNILRWFPGLLVHWDKWLGN